MRSKTVQNRSSARQVSAEPWHLDRQFPFYVCDYTHRRRQPGPFHIHNVLEIGWCHSGDGVFMVEDKAYSFKAGDVYVISSFEAHYAQPGGNPSDWSFIFLDPPRLLGAGTDPALFDLTRCCGPGFNNLFRFDLDTRFCQCVKEIVREYRERHGFFQDAIKALVVNLLVELKRRQSDRASSLHSARSYESMRSIEPALKIIAREYQSPLTLKRLAKSCFMSGSHFRRVFTSQMGAAPRDYLLGYRISMAACLLKGTSKPIAEIALDTGFETLSSFNRQFQKRKRCSPREWRKHAD